MEGKLNEKLQLPDSTSQVSIWKMSDLVRLSRSVTICSFTWPLPQWDTALSGTPRKLQLTIITGLAYSVSAVCIQAPDLMMSSSCCYLFFNLEASLEGHSALSRPPSGTSTGCLKGASSADFCWLFWVSGMTMCGCLSRYNLSTTCYLFFHVGLLYTC